MKYSPSAKKIVKEKKGFRNEELYASGERKLEKVIEHEVHELGNSDIFYTLLELYPKTKEFLNEKQLDEYFLTDEDYEEEVKEILKKTIEWIKKEMEEEKLKAIWVCSTKEEVVTYYSGTIYETDEEDDEEIEEINITEVNFEEKMLVISDLSEEGVLVVSKEIEEI